MGKERKAIYQTDQGFSEKALDLAVDKGLTNDQVKAGNIFDPQKKKKKNEDDRR